MQGSIGRDQNPVKGLTTKTRLIDSFNCVQEDTLKVPVMLMLPSSKYIEKSSMVAATGGVPSLLELW